MKLEIPADRRLAERLAKIERELDAVQASLSRRLDVLGARSFAYSGSALGTLAAAVGYTWTAVPVGFVRALPCRFTVTSSTSTNWALQVTSQPAGAGEVMFQAGGIGDLSYSCSWPWVYENQQAPQQQLFHIGVRNIAGPTSSFVLTDLRGEILL